MNKQLHSVVELRRHLQTMQIIHPTQCKLCVKLKLKPYERKKKTWMKNDVVETRNERIQKDAIESCVAIIIRVKI